ncbi:Calx-beta domain-containing protein [Dactylosporangium sp. AC04546]|uniref:Calx-beta domain-containing protein n=1 Tax=Dactylosporangium sp. AC04546 TaxID=2862460 RepID=UPI001EE11E5B|nr:Calx-beta domain-containing protein [Dactylosporangium sp. AC04546]WVK87894.1 Calx-beta domain-containing protein [Dactylosporangium sp. AC04546]
MKRFAAALVLGLVMVAGAAAPAAAGPTPPSGCPAREVVAVDAAVREGNPPSRPSLVFTVTALGCATGSVGFRTAYGPAPTATPGADYTVATGTITWAEGDPPDRQVAVEVIGDFLREPDELLNLELVNPVGLTILDGTATGTILNDDLDMVLIHPDSEPDCDRITWTCDLWVFSSQRASVPTTVGWMTADGTATGGDDFVPVPSGTVVIPAGANKAKLTVHLLPGATGYFYVRLAGGAATTVTI